MVKEVKEWFSRAFKDFEEAKFLFNHNRPLEYVALFLHIEEHAKVRLILEIEEERRKKAEEILALARKSCEGFSEEELSILESTRLDTTRFFSNRGDSK